MSKWWLIITFLTRTPVSTDQTETGAVFARSQITTLDLSCFATIACLTNAGALLSSIGLCSGRGVLVCVGSIPLGGRRWRRVGNRSN